MILAPVRFLANRHILLAIGDLQEIRIRRQKRKFGPKWSFAAPSLDQVEQFEAHIITLENHNIVEPFL